MTRPVALTIFCEDVRPEMSGATTLVGVMSDDLALPSIPGALGRLCAYTRVIVPIDMVIESLSTALVVNDVEVARVDFENDLFRSARKEAKGKGAPSVGFIGNISAAPFVVDRPTTIHAITTVNGEELLTGYLRLTSVQPTA